MHTHELTILRGWPPSPSHFAMVDTQLTSIRAGYGRTWSPHRILSLLNDVSARSVPIVIIKYINKVDIAIYQVTHKIVEHTRFT